MEDRVQADVNKLSGILRLQVIEYLLKKDCLDNNAPMPTEEELLYKKRAINAMPCCTKLLKKLFKDAHEMHEEKGMFPHTVSVYDLEWCLKYRCIGYRCTQRVKHSWIVSKEDTDLRALPAFRELVNVYRPMINENKPLLPPVDKQETINEAMKIVNQIGFAEA